MTESKRLSEQNIRFGIKLFLSYVAFTLILIISVIAISHYFLHDVQEKQFAREANLQSTEKKKKFNHYLQTKKDALLAISHNQHFLDFIDKKLHPESVNILFSTLMEANKDYMQIEYIDIHNLQVLQFNQNEKSPTYTSYNSSKNATIGNMSRMKKEEVLISNIDLNINEKQHKPTVQFSLPIYTKETLRGVLVIHIVIDDVLKSLTNSCLFDIYVMDSSENSIHQNHGALNWSYYGLGKMINKTLLPKIDTIKSSKFINDALFVQPLLTGDQKLYMIMAENDASIEMIEQRFHKMIIAILLLASVVSLFFTFLFIKTLKKIFNLVTAQSDALYELATDLDTKVKQKSQEIAIKDRLLQNQSKLAELGEMMANIAHQWIQPLTRLSLIVQNLTAFKSKARMSDEIFNESMQNALYQIDFMSNTIDNFKNFYKPDDNIAEFFIEDAIYNILDIIGAVIEQSNITIAIHSTTPTSLYANKHEFSHVVMNLIINAKDAIDERNIRNGKIDINIKQEGHIIIEVCDNAGGVAESIIDEIFNPYFTTKEKHGTGIGLYLSKAIIENKMGGKLSVKNSDEGAVFVIVLNTMKDS